MKTAQTWQLAILFFGLFVIPGRILEHFEAAGEASGKAALRQATEKADAIFEQGQAGPKAALKRAQAELKAQDSLLLDETSALRDARSGLAEAKAKTLEAKRALEHSSAALKREERAYKATRFGAYAPELNLTTLRLEEALRVIAERVFKPHGISARVEPSARGFRLSLSLPRGTPSRLQDAVLQGLSEFERGAEAAWISELTIARPGVSPVSLGALAKLPPAELSLFLRSFLPEGGRLPPPRRAKAPVKKVNYSLWKITNGTSKVLLVRYYGAERGSTSILKGSSETLKLKPGSYWVAVSALSLGVRPFSGSYTFEAGYLFESSFVIRSAKQPR